VIREFNQKKVIDCFNTYSLVTKIATITTVIASTIIHDLVVHQIDVKTPFLDGALEEEMCIPEQDNKVCKN